MRLLITGDRRWDEPLPIRRCLEDLKPDVIIHGAARGADRLADVIAESLGIEREPYPADWGRYKKGAGPIRNQQMLDEGKPDLVVFFHRSLEGSSGTGDMVARALLSGLPVRSYLEWVSFRERKKNAG